MSIRRLRPQRPVGRGRDLDGEPTAAGFLPTHLHVSGGRPVAPLHRPPLVSARTLDVPGADLVLGAERGGEARVYLVSVIWQHHLVHDEVGGEPLLVTFCRNCFSGVAFDPRVDDQQLSFDVFGGYRGGFAMRDQQTGTVWDQLTGEALTGPLVGQQLEMTPTEMTTWSEWLGRHPGSTTPDPSAVAAPRRVAPGVAKLGDAWQRMVPHLDERLPPRTLVLGLAVGDAARAYVLAGEPGSAVLRQDELNGVPLVLLSPRGAWPRAYGRRTDAGPVILERRDGALVDATGSRWTEQGHAIEGPLAGTSLPFLPARVVEWYAWSAHFPATDIAEL